MQMKIEKCHIKRYKVAYNRDLNAKSEDYIQGTCWISFAAICMYQTYPDDVTVKGVNEIRIKSVGDVRNFKEPYI